LNEGEYILKNDFSMEFKKLGLKIAYYRKLKGYTQEQLSELMEVATSYVGAIEAPNMDKPISLTTLFKIARILDTPVQKFLDFD
jgi:transcriptional regulator with XRE-family HTH domain